MKKLYNILTEVLRTKGFNITTWGDNTLIDDERTLALTIKEMSQIQPQFDTLQATITITFFSGDWAENAINLSDAITTFIPIEDRVDAESKSLPDNSDKLTLLEVPLFEEIEIDIDDETAEEQQTLNMTIHFNY
jgi:hypothetical protein